MSATLERIEAEIAREVLDRVDDAILDLTVQTERDEATRLRAFAFAAAEQVAKRYGVSRHPPGGYE